MKDTELTIEEVGRIVYDVSDYLIKLSGKAELPEPLEIGMNYEIKAKGTITSINEADKDDGSRTFTYKFEPVIIEVISESGKAIKAKDVRQKSRQLRAALWREWKENGENIEFEDYYNQKMDEIIKSIFLI